jgi:hypothetical protein
MKTNKSTLFLMALLGVFIFSGCEDKREEPQPTQSIVQLAQAQPNLSSLATAFLQHHIISAPTTARRVFSRNLITGSVPSLNGYLSISVTAVTVTSGNCPADEE